MRFSKQSTLILILAISVHFACVAGVSQNGQFVNWNSEPDQSTNTIECNSTSVLIGKLCFNNPSLQTERPGFPKCSGSSDSDLPLSSVPDPSPRFCSMESTSGTCVWGDLLPLHFGSKSISWNSKVFTFGGCLAAGASASTGLVAVFSNGMWHRPVQKGTPPPNDLCAQAVGRLGNSSLVAVHGGSNLLKNVLPTFPLYVFDLSSYTWFQIPGDHTHNHGRPIDTWSNRHFLPSGDRIFYIDNPGSSYDGGQIPLFELHQNWTWSDVTPPGQGPKNATLRFPAVDPFTGIVYFLVYPDTASENPVYNIWHIEMPDPMNHLTWSWQSRELSGLSLPPNPTFGSIEFIGPNKAVVPVESSNSSEYQLVQIETSTGGMTLLPTVGRGIKLGADTSTVLVEQNTLMFIGGGSEAEIYPGVFIVKMNEPPTASQWLDFLPQSLSQQKSILYNSSRLGFHRSVPSNLKVGNAVYCYGGLKQDSNPTGLNSFLKLSREGGDGTDLKWQEISGSGSLPSGSSVPVIFATDLHIFVLGGMVTSFDFNLDSMQPIIGSDISAFEISSETWDTVTPSNFPYMGWIGGTAFALDNQTGVVIGGIVLYSDGGGFGTRPISSIGKFEVEFPLSVTFSETSTSFPQIDRFLHGIAYSASRATAYVFGGVRFSGNEAAILGDVVAISFSTNDFTSSQSMYPTVSTLSTTGISPGTRALASVVLLEDSLFVYAGMVGKVPGLAAESSFVYRLRLSDNHWFQLQPTSSRSILSRRSPCMQSMSIDGTDFLVVFGSETGGSTVSLHEFASSTSFLLGMQSSQSIQVHSAVEFLNSFAGSPSVNDTVLSIAVPLLQLDASCVVLGVGSAPRHVVIESSNSLSNRAVLQISSSFALVCSQKDGCSGISVVNVNFQLTESPTLSGTAGSLLPVISFDGQVSAKFLNCEIVKDQISSHHRLFLRAENLATVVFDGCVVSHLIGDSAGSLAQLVGSSMLLNNISTHNCSSTGNGGLVNAFSSESCAFSYSFLETQCSLKPSVVTVTNSTFTTSSSSNGCGGVLYASRSNILMFDVIMEYAFSGAQSVCGGGAILAVSSSSVNLTSTRISNSRARFNGGAIHVKQSSLTVVGCSISDNQADGHGGAIFCEDSACQLRESALRNSANGGGGNVYWQKSLPVIDSQTFSSCVGSSSYGGCIASNVSALASMSTSAPPPPVSSASSFHSTYFDNMEKFLISNSHAVESVPVMSGQEIDKFYFVILDHHGSEITQHEEYVAELSLVAGGQISLLGPVIVRVLGSRVVFQGVSVRYAADHVNSTLRSLIQFNAGDHVLHVNGPTLKFGPCIAGHFLQNPDSNLATCTKCPEGSYSLSESIWSQRGSCLACPQGKARCSGGSDIVALEGFWQGLPSSNLYSEGVQMQAGLTSVQSNRISANIYRCSPGHCKGNNTCSDGHTGVLCGLCMPGYTLDSGQCVSCPADVGVYRPLSAVAGSIICLGVVYFFALRPVIGAEVSKFAKRHMKNFSFRKGKVIPIDPHNIDSDETGSKHSATASVSSQGFPRSEPSVGHPRSSNNSANEVMPHDIKRAANNTTKDNQDASSENSDIPTKHGDELLGEFDDAKEIWMAKLTMLQGTLKILVSLFQILSSYVTVFSVQWPSSFLSFLTGIGVTNFNFIGFPGTACLSQGFSFLHKQVVILLLPLLLIFIMAVAWAVKKRVLLATMAEMKDAKGRMVRSFFWIYYLIFPSAAATSLQAFACSDLGPDGQYLTADLTISCDSEEYSIVFVLGMLGVLQYIILFPGILLLSMHRLQISTVARERFRKTALQYMFLQDCAKLSFTPQTVDFDSFIGTWKADEEMQGDQCSEDEPTHSNQGNHRNFPAGKATKIDISREDSEASTASGDDAHSSAKEFDSLRPETFFQKAWELHSGQDKQIGSGKNGPQPESTDDWLDWYLEKAIDLIAMDLLALPCISWDPESDDDIERRAMRYLGFLLENYEVQYWWWELVELFRKLIMTSLMIFIFEGTATQISIALLLCIVFFTVYMQYKPFVESDLDKLQVSSLGIQLLTLFYGLLLFVQASPDEGTESVVFSYMLVTINACIVAQGFWDSVGSILVDWFQAFRAGNLKQVILASSEG